MRSIVWNNACAETINVDYTNDYTQYKYINGFLGTYIVQADMPDLDVDTYMYFYVGLISHRIITTLLEYCAREHPIRKAITCASPLFLLLSSHIIRVEVHRGLHTPQKI